MKIDSKIINQTEERGFSGESNSEITFSETEMEAAKQLMQLSDDTLSCSSGTAWSVCEGKEEGYNTKRQEDVVSSKVTTNHRVGKEQNDSELRNNNVADERSFIKAMMETKGKIKKKNKKYRSLESIYRATKEIRSSAHEAKDD